MVPLHLFHTAALSKLLLLLEPALRLRSPGVLLPRLQCQVLSTLQLRRPPDPTTALPPSRILGRLARPPLMLDMVCLVHV